MASSEELDRHLRSHLERLECTFLDEWTAGGGDIASLTAPQCFEAIVRLLWRIRPSLRSSFCSFLLPPSATARFRMATLVSQAIKAVGVREAYGFQSILYGSGKDLSSLFIALLQLTPGQDGKEVDEQETFHSSILRQSGELASDDVHWVPEFCRLLKLKHDGRFWCPGEEESELFPLSRVLDRSLADVLESPIDRRELAAMLYSEGLQQKETSGQTTEAAAASTPRQKPTIAPKPSLIQEESAAPVEDEAARLEREEAEAELREASVRFEESRSVHEKIQSKRAKMAQERVGIEAELATYDEKLMAILGDSEEARRKIEKFIDDRDERVEKLEQKWEGVRAEKMAELTELRKQMDAKGGADSVHERLVRVQQEMERLQESKDAYEKRAEKLAVRVAAIDEGDAINRHQYVKKLMEVTANLQKQREELHKVWHETDMISKEIKWAEQASMRTFDLLEDALYKKTELSPKGERLYKAFAAMYNKCNLIVKEAETVGASKQRNEEMVEKVDQANKAPFLAQLSPMLEDLASIEDENRRLEELLENA